MDRAGKERVPRSRCHIWGQRLLQAERPGAGRRRWAQGLRAGQGGAPLPATCGLRSGRQSVRSSDDCAAPPGPQRRGRSLLPPPPPGPALSEHARTGVCQGGTGTPGCGVCTLQTSAAHKPWRGSSSEARSWSSTHAGTESGKGPKVAVGERAWWEDSDSHPRAFNRWGFSESLGTCMAWC